MFHVLVWQRVAPSSTEFACVPSINFEEIVMSIWSLFMPRSMHTRKYN